MLCAFGPTDFLERIGRIVKESDNAFDPVPVIVMRLMDDCAILFFSDVPACCIVAYDEVMNVTVIDEIAFEHHATSLERRRRGGNCTASKKRGEVAPGQIPGNCQDPPAAGRRKLTGAAGISPSRLCYRIAKRGR